jgi:hypothetical protein
MIIAHEITILSKKFLEIFMALRGCYDITPMNVLVNPISILHEIKKCVRAKYLGSYHQQ